MIIKRETNTEVDEFFKLFSKTKHHIEHELGKITLVDTDNCAPEVLKWLKDKGIIS